MEPGPEDSSQHVGNLQISATTLSHPLCCVFPASQAKASCAWMKEIRAMRALLDRCRSSKKARGRPPEGCLAVYVGAARERFVVRAECVNHRLFRALLEEAEEARGPYGYAADGPLELPCDAAAFARAVEAIEREMAGERQTAVGCGGIVWAGHSAAAAAQHRTVAVVVAGGTQVMTVG